MSISDMMSKKVGGVPVVYIAAGGAAILGVIAWRMKPTESGEEAAETLSPEEEAAGSLNNPYDALATNGTVVVQPSTPTPVETPEIDRPDTNDEWIRQGAQWLIEHEKAGSNAAYLALSKYVRGESRSTLEAQWVDKVIKAIGYPPDPFVESPTTPPPKPPTPKPPPNPDPKPKNHMTPAPGSWPGYGWYKVKAGDSARSISNKYGLTLATFYAFNGVGRIHIGEWVKVRAGSNPTWGYKGK